MKQVKTARGRSEYWQRLRRDKASNFSAGAMALSCLFAVVCWIGILVPGNQAHGRASPIYWIFMLPFAWWGGSLMHFTPWSVQVMRLMFWIAPLGAAGAAVFAAFNTPEFAIPSLIALGLTCAMSAIGYVLYRHSLLRREGPFIETD
ncbi:hypothetical protein UCD39_11345 [Nitrospirillum sp. BR 11752]|uniref:hypothetical protein n=1 Tax=Nitrospirillum sp. BR 11752 TaxID=3104293 RepID=UPI002EB244AE|nr:hypothetical protein [Nitrospirillum sp. BR 11752]